MNNIKIAIKLAFKHKAAITPKYIDWLTRSFQAGDPWRHLLESNGVEDIPKLFKGMEDEEIRAFTEQIISVILKPIVVDKIKRVTLKGGDQLNMAILKRLPLMQDVQIFARLLSAFDSPSANRIKSKYGFKL